MNAKHQFKYTYSDTELEKISPVEVTFDMPGEVTITQMLFNFECYLKACGFVFDGRLEMVEDENESCLDYIEDEPQGGCMADWDDDECGCKDNTKWKEEAQEKLNEWNEGLAKLEREVKKNKWVHGICNPPSPDWKK